MITPDLAQRAAESWVAAWNSRDLDTIMSHYTDDVTFWSPMIVKLMGDPNGKIVGKEGLRAYFTRGLAATPALHFTLLHVLTGVDSVTIYYRRHDNVEVAEVTTLNADGQATQIHCYYSANSTVWQL